MAGEELSLGPPASAVLYSGSGTEPGLKSLFRMGSSLGGPQLEAPNLLMPGEEVVLGVS